MEGQMMEEIDLDVVRLTPAAYRRWVTHTAKATFGMAVDPAFFPIERGRIHQDGSLEIYVELPGGREISMHVLAEEWALDPE